MKIGSKKGFTLIELLVVIGIIGILSTVVFASLNDSRSKSRNARRNSDVKQLLNAFGLGLANSSPPYTLPASTGWYCVSLDCYDQWNIYDEAADKLANANVDTFLNPYLPIRPSDPNGGNRDYGGYLYRSSWNSTSSYDGFVFPLGAYLYWAVEPPANSKSCGTGHISVYTVGGAYIHCAEKID